MVTYTTLQGARIDATATMPMHRPFETFSSPPRIALSSRAVRRNAMPIMGPSYEYDPRICRVMGISDAAMNMFLPMGVSLTARMMSIAA